jgi:hypothetical protein
MRPKMTRETIWVMTDPDPKPPAPFEQLGGVDGVRALVDRFYGLMTAARY